MHNTHNSYGHVTKIFHWVMGLMILGVLIAGFIMTRLEVGPLKATFYDTHKAFGFILLLLIPLRLGWFFYSIRPAMPKGIRPWQKKAMRLNINFLYAAMILMPLSGTLMSLFSGRGINLFNFFAIAPIFDKNPLGPVPYQIHIWLAYILAGSIILHISAALYHHFIRGDDLLNRILWVKK